MPKIDQAFLAKISNRHFRKKNGLCLAEGLRCCQEAVTRQPASVYALLASQSFAQSSHWEEFRAAAPQARVSILADQDFAQISETETPQGILAVLAIPENRMPAAAGHPFTLILDQVADPGNLGTILRTAWAVGLDSCWLVKGSADPFSPKAVRSGMGAQFALSLHTIDTLQEAVALARKLGSTRIWCTLPGRGISIFDSGFFLPGTALIIGNEANGISDPSVGEAVTIPMPGHAESLNAAQAATVFLVSSLKEK